MKNAALLVVLAILLLGCAQPAGGPGTNDSEGNKTLPSGGGNDSASTNSVDVRISGFSFSPSEVSVRQGGTVVWTNEDSVPHTIRFAAFESQSINSGERYQHTFTEEPGEYDYSCGIHPSMQGKVTVSR